LALPFGIFACLFAAFAFSVPGLQYLFNPVATATKSFGYAPDTPFAITNIRVAFGAFHMVPVVVALGAIVLRRVLVGVTVAWVFCALAVSTRIYGLYADGPTEKFRVAVAGEGGALIVFTIALAWMLWARRRA
jgi:hypothetical protein